jgi:hypothetical protein
MKDSVFLDLLDLGFFVTRNPNERRGAVSRPFFYTNHEHPVVDPHVSHFMQVPLRTRVKLPHSEHISPS